MEIFVSPSRSNRKAKYYSPWTVSVSDGNLKTTLVGRYAHKSNAVRAARALPGSILRPAIRNQNNKNVAVLKAPDNRITLGSYTRNSDAKKRISSFFQRLAQTEGFTLVDKALV